MSDQSWEHAAAARAALNAIVTDPDHGVAALSNAHTMSNLLKDLLPDAPREKSILVAAAEAGLADTLREHIARGMDPSTAIRLTASSFSATSPLTPESCAWVTGEIAGVLGIIQPGGPGRPGGGIGGRPSGFGVGSQAAPTRAAPIPGYTPVQGSTPGRPQDAVSGQAGFGQGTEYNQGGGGQGGGGQGGVDPGATLPGGWPKGTQGLNQQADGGASGWQPGQAGYSPSGTGQPAGSASGWQPGQAGYSPSGTGWQPAGTGQPAGGASGWQPGQQGYGPAGTGQPAGGGWQPPGTGQPAGGGWQPAGYGQPGGFGPVGPKRSRRGWYIGGGILVVIIVVVVIVASLSGTPASGPSANSSPPHTPRSTTPANPTSPATNPTAIQPLTTIMNAPGEPIGKTCTATPPVFGLNKATIVGRRFCTTTTSRVIVWAYQFDNQADFRAGFAHIKHYTGFDKSSSYGHHCPPSSSFSDGKTGWFIKNSPRYDNRAHNQELDCFFNGKTPRPTLMWSMPTQNAFFIAKDQKATASIQTVVNWWESIHYAS